MCYFAEQCEHLQESAHPWWSCARWLLLWSIQILMAGEQRFTAYAMIITLSIGLTKGLHCRCDRSWGAGPGIFNTPYLTVGIGRLASLRESANLLLMYA